LQLGDRATLALAHLELFRSLGARTTFQAKKAFAEIQSLRNNPAHAQDFVDEDWAAIVRLSLRVDDILKRRHDGARRPGGARGGQE
jgi:hypothetical protein